MKIIFIISSLSTGGAEIMLLKLIENIDLVRFKPVVVCLSSKGKIGPYIENLGVPVYELKMNKGFPSPYKFMRLIKLLNWLKGDLVHTWMYHADLLGGGAAKLIGCSKIIWGVRNTDVFAGNGVSTSTGLIMQLCAWLSNTIPKTIICVAESAKRTHVAMGYTEHKMKVIGNGFNVDTYKPNTNARNRIREILNLPSNALVIGSIGRFNKYKDHHNFILACGEVASATNCVHFLMVGRDVDPFNLLIKKWIDETGYAERFILLGERDNIPDILSAMDVFCLHSVSEGFPNVLGEAMSTGLPSVVTDVGDVARLLGTAGLVVPSRNHSALAAGLLKLIDATPEERTNLGRIARKRIKEHWSIQRITQQYEQLYQDVWSS